MLEHLHRLCLVRHGETDWNREGRLQGLTDFELNERGRCQARALCERLRGEAADGLYSSPLSRAFETASIVGEAFGREPVRIDGLRERDVGVWGGMTFDEVKVRYPDEWERVAAGEDLPIGGGETRSEVMARMAAAVDDIAERHAGGTVYVVGHGLALKMLVCHILGIDVLHADRLATFPNTSLTVFEVRRGVPRMTSYGDAAHLENISLPI
ncbi:MAG: histidine phosphatase family protein [Planctomycetes bacterium]|nr:histidine phosphatase family protein [Planctomycetota bacterium]